MYCLHPILVRKYAELKDGSHKRVNNYRQVPCGKCVACLSRKRNEWTYRLCKENECSSYSFFGTLTYDDAHIPVRNNDEGVPFFVFRKSDCQKYIKRIRYFLKELNPNMFLTYYLISEYGGQTQRPHYHALFFVKNDNYMHYKNIMYKVLHDEWFHGFSSFTPISQANIHYVTKYAVKSLDQESGLLEDTFMICSKDSYLGSGFEVKLEQQCDAAPGSDPVVFLNGYRQHMPRIYRQKLNVGTHTYGQSSGDPRLSEDKYKRYREKYMRTHKEFDEHDFARYINACLYYFEQNSIRKQLQRNEKL